jgi:hypothetical protein
MKFENTGRMTSREPMLVIDRLSLVGTMGIQTNRGATLKPNYMNGKGEAKLGHVVMTQGNIRAIVIGIVGTFVKVHGFGTHKESGEIVVLNWVNELPASQCVLLDDQTLSGEIMKRLGLL